MRVGLRGPFRFSPFPSLTRFLECFMEFYALVSRVRAEFLEMPGLRLTQKQASRLWGMDDSVCRRVVESLVESSFLRRAEGGTFVRAGQ